MFAQNLFYYTASFAIILIAIILFFVLLIWLTTLMRITKMLKKFENTFDSAAKKFDDTLDTIKNKIKFSSFFAIFTQGVKEIISFIHDIRKNKEEIGRKKSPRI